MGKNDTEKKGSLPASFSALTNTRRRRAAMVAVGDVKERNLREFGFKEPDTLLILNHPGRMTHPISSGEIDLRRFGHFPRRQFIDPFVGLVRQKYRPGLGIKRFD